MQDFSTLALFTLVKAVLLDSYHPLRPPPTKVPVVTVSSCDNPKRVQTFPNVPLNMSPLVRTLASMNTCL